MTTDADCTCGDCSTGDLPVNPFEALRVSYGMLLGADDFRALIGNPRGKQMMHSAWLHGSGVVWGFDVHVDGEVSLTVSPGLAVDGLGRELACEKSSCLDLRDWLGAHDKPGNRDGCEQRTVHACLVVEFGCSLSTPVPTLANPCDVTRQHDDFSRVVESATVSLRPGPCATRERPYHRVRVLLGLDEVGGRDPAGDEGVAARRKVAETPVEQRASVLLQHFRRLAALDSAQLRPAAEPGAADLTYFPVLESAAAVVLADIVLDVRDADGCTTIKKVRDPDTTGRTVLLPTRTVQDLVCGLAPGVVGDVAVPDAGGPRVLGDKVKWSPDERLCVLPVSAPLNPGSVRRAVHITSLSPRGWVDEDIDAIRYDGDAPALVIELADRPVNPLIRVIVRGTGPTPLYGDEPPVPLAGLWGSSTPGTEDDGHDAVITFPNPLSESGEGR